MTRAIHSLCATRARVGHTSASLAVLIDPAVTLLDGGALAITGGCQFLSSPLIVVADGGVETKIFANFRLIRIATTIAANGIDGGRSGLCFTATCWANGGWQALQFSSQIVPA